MLLKGVANVVTNRGANVITKKHTNVVINRGTNVTTNRGINGKDAKYPESIFSEATNLYKNIFWAQRRIC